MAIVLNGGDRDYLWRIALDKTWARYALHAQLVLAAKRAEPAAPPLTLADARDFRPSAEILKTWTEQVPLVDVPVPFTADRHRQFAAAVRRDSILRAARRQDRRANKRATG